MPNFLCTRALQLLQDSSDWESLDLRAILLDNTSTVGSQEDITAVSGYSTLGEVTGTGYARQALANIAVTLDNATNSIKLTADHLSYGGISVGNVAAILIYQHVTDDDDSIPFIYLDNAFTVTAAAPAIVGSETIYVDPIPDRILNTTVLTFTGPSIVTLTATANAGARQLSVEPLDDAIALAATATSPTPGFPIPTNGGPLTITLPANLLEVLAV